MSEREAAQARAEHRASRVSALLDAGVCIIDPNRVSIDDEAEIASGVVLHPDVAVLGSSVIAEGCVLHQGAWLREATLASGVEVLPYSVIDGAVVGEGAAIGPFARLRPGTELGTDVKVGNFVEIKKSKLAAGTKASHLAYIGDATLGERVNVGAGAVTCNYDGENKHETTIGDDVFVGSDCMLVAPVTLGDGAVTGAGSTITKDVPEGALAVGRARQRNIPDWRKK